MPAQCSCLPKGAPAIVPAVICFPSCNDSTNYLVVKHQAEVFPLSRGMMSPCGSMPIPAITDGLSISPPSHTSIPHSAPCGLPALVGGNTGLPRSTYLTRMDYCLDSGDHFTCLANERDITRYLYNTMFRSRLLTMKETSGNGKP